MQNPLLYETEKVQKKSNEGESSCMNDTESETDGESVDVNNEQIARDQESEDVDDELKETDVVQKNDQQQEIEGMEQEIGREIDQKEETNMNGKEITDMDKNCGGNTKDVHVATQNKADQ